MCRFLYLVLIVTPLIALSGCNTTFKEGQVNLASELRNRGTNPYIKAPVLKDLELRIRNIAMEPIVRENPNSFGPRDLEILGNFFDRYHHRELMATIRLSAAGYDQAASRLYPVTGSSTNCQVRGNNAIFAVPDKSNKYKTYDWKFVAGDCHDGVAHGNGEARSRHGQARFTGYFDNGTMIEGVFEGYLDNGDRFINIGSVPTSGVIARLLTTIYRKSGFRYHRFGDIDEQGLLDGFGILIRNYTNRMVVSQVGDFLDNKLEGFGAFQALRKAYESKAWYTWIGTWRSGKLDGLGAWTDGFEDINLGEWQNGKQHGLTFEQYSDMTGDYHEFAVGQKRRGKRHGSWQLNRANTFTSEDYATKVYNNGNLVSSSDRPAFTVNQVMAFALGAATISVADVPSAAKVQIAGALAADTLGGGGGTNLASMQKSFAKRAKSARQSTNSSATSSSAGGGIKVDQVQITCPHSGPHTIPVPYRTQQCRRAAIDFATTFVCNRMDQNRVIRNCKTACSNHQCLQE